MTAVRRDGCSHPSGPLLRSSPMATSRTSSRTASGLELLLAADRTSPEPVHRQLGSSLRHVVRSGRLQGGDAVPSSRELARQLGVSRGVVVEAYEQLVA